VVKVDNSGQERDFQGVWIPKEIWLNEELTIQEKALLVEIKSLDNEVGCYAKNKHFMEFLGVGERRIQLIIQGLIKRGYLTSTFKYKEGTKEIEKRTLKVDKVKYFGIQKGENIPNEVVNKSTPPPGEESCTTPGEEKFAVSNTIYIKKKKKEKSEFDIVIEKYTVNEKLRNVLYEFIKSRKAIKKPATTEALKRILKKLDGLTTSDDEKIAILGESIMNGWAGVFPLKKETSKKNSDWEEGYF
jgi:hypothetical protein